MTAPRQSLKTLNPDMDHRSIKTESAMCTNRIHSMMVDAFTATNQEQGEAALNDMHGLQGHCLDMIHRLVGMQILDEMKPRAEQIAGDLDYAALIDFISGVGMSCEAVNYQVQRSRTINK